MHRLLFIPAAVLLSASTLLAQSKSLVNTSNSKFARVQGVDMGSVRWTSGFWAERFAVCRDSMAPGMWRTLSNPNVAHAYRNFEIAAGLHEGEHQGPPFHDGDFYKWLEGLAAVYSITKEPAIDKQMDEIVATIAKAQRPDGYIHTPVIIEQKSKGIDAKFSDRLNFETYNLGHLMTAGIVHYRATGKTSLLSVARKAADYLNEFYATASAELARNAICPSHYMGVVEMYRTTQETKYLELAKNLIDIRGLVQNGTDDNQDRVPFRQQKKAMGHAVRANYLYAGAADIYAETGDSTLLESLSLIWDDMALRKMYITGACGALYDGVSPDGTSYTPDSIQKVHQAYGRDYQLPNATAHNESCANIGNVLWSWRMFQISGNPKYIDVLELALYNSVLAGVSLDGRRYFYTNPLAVSDKTPFTLRWSKEREEYIKLCNCCPPNTVRTIAEVQSYAYGLSDRGVWVNLYGGSTLETQLKDGRKVRIEQQSEYPWMGEASLTVQEVGKGKKGQPFSLFLRIPAWAKSATLTVNGVEENRPQSGQYVEVRRLWKKGDVVELSLPMEATLVEANPLAEEVRNQVAVKRGPVVYCLESPDAPEGRSIFDLSIPADIRLTPIPITIANSSIICLEGKACATDSSGWSNRLYREVKSREKDKVFIRLIPYYAWGNRGRSEMTVWMPLSR
ncbi:MAG: glycoside hydrolase family 127 protein [Prevotellaceae bacterium]|nr:glycoside hydrolase family 127 protein [Prevotellaceae bacterium]